MRTFKIAIGSDHAGFKYKEAIKTMLLENGHTVRDFGTHSEVACDYPDFVRPVAEAVARGECERGIVLGGSGNGEAIVANRVRGVRCGVCWTEQVAVWNRSHNDANVLALGQRTGREKSTCLPPKFFFSCALTRLPQRFSLMFHNMFTFQIFSSFTTFCLTAKASDSLKILSQMKACLSFT